MSLAKEKLDEFIREYLEKGSLEHYIIAPDFDYVLAYAPAGYHKGIIVLSAFWIPIWMDYGEECKPYLITCSPTSGNTITYGSNPPPRG